MAAHAHLGDHALMLDDVTTVLIVDDNSDARAALRRQLEFAGLAVVGDAMTGGEAVEHALALRPDTVLVELDRTGLDGLGTVAALAQHNPGCPVVAIAAGDELTLIRQAMLAGARAYLRRPFVGDEAVAVIREVRRRVPKAGAVPTPLPRPVRTSGRVVAVTGAGGGVGRTTLAVNLALAGHARGVPTVIVDADLSFGDVAAMLDLRPEGPTLADLAVGADPAEAAVLDPADVPRIVRTHGSGLRAVLGPSDPRAAAAMPRSLVPAVVNELSRRFAAVIVDLPRPLEDDAVSILDMADWIVVPFVPHAAAVHAIGAYLSLIDRLGLGDRLVPVVNRFDWPLAIAVDDVERALGRPMAHLLADDPRIEVSVNAGRPVVLHRSTSPFAMGVSRLAGDLLDLRPIRELGEPSALQRAWQGMRGFAPRRSGASVTNSNEMGHPSQYV